MSLRVLTAAGSLKLGDAPSTGLVCAFCREPALLVVDDPRRTIATCSQCAEDAIVIGLVLAGPTDLRAGPPADPPGPQAAA